MFYDLFGIVKFENVDFQGKIPSQKREYKVPDDYKINQCHSHTLFVEIDSNRFENHTRAMFDEHFTQLPFLFSCENLPITKCVEKPLKFISLIFVAKILGNDFNYVRVDLYNVGLKIYVGDLDNGKSWARECKLDTQATSRAFGRA